LIDRRSNGKLKASGIPHKTASAGKAILAANIALTEDFEADYECVALSHPREYALNDGAIVSSVGLNIPVRDFDQVFLEEHVAHSTALHTVRAEHGSSCHVGPLARMNLNRSQLPPAARQAKMNVGSRSHDLIPMPELSPGLWNSLWQLYHRYRINDQGIVQSAKIVPPTCQNCRRIEDDLRLVVHDILDRPDAEIVDACEKLVRNYDPCISCSTHVVRIQINRR
jgi:sulfhydrogenase subunit alpha